MIISAQEYLFSRIEIDFLLFRIALLSSRAQTIDICNILFRLAKRLIYGLNGQQCILGIFVFWESLHHPLVILEGLVVPGGISRYHSKLNQGAGNEIAILGIAAEELEALDGIGIVLNVNISPSELVHCLRIKDSRRRSIHYRSESRDLLFLVS